MWDKQQALKDFHQVHREPTGQNVANSLKPYTATCRTCGEAERPEPPEPDDGTRQSRLHSSSQGEAGRVQPDKEPLLGSLLLHPRPGHSIPQPAQHAGSARASAIGGRFANREFADAPAIRPLLQDVEAVGRKLLNCCAGGWEGMFRSPRYAGSAVAMNCSNRQAWFSKRSCHKGAPIDRGPLIALKRYFLPRALHPSTAANARGNSSCRPFAEDALRTRTTAYCTYGAGLSLGSLERGRENQNAIHLEFRVYFRHEVAQRARWRLLLADLSALCFVELQIGRESTSAFAAAIQPIDQVRRGLHAKNPLAPGGPRYNARPAVFFPTACSPVPLPQRVASSATIS